MWFSLSISQLFWPIFAIVFVSLQWCMVHSWPDFVVCCLMPPEHGVDEHLQMLLAMEGVHAVEENVVITRTTTPVPWTWGAIPWHLDRIAEKYLPLDGTYNVPYTGQGHAPLSRFS